MNKYYLKILEQMGFRLHQTEPKKVSVYLIDNLATKPISVIDLNENNFVYKDDNINGKRVIIKEGYVSLFAKNIQDYYVTAEEEFQDETLGLSIYSGKTDNRLGIEVFKILKKSRFIENDKLCKIRIDVSYPRNLDIMDQFVFELYSNQGKFITIKFGYGSKCFNINVDECNCEQIVNCIFNYLKTTELADDIGIIKGLKMVMPAIVLCIDDIIKSCKKEIKGSTK